MNEAEIKKKIELLTEMVITKVDYHFHECVLEDILDCGQVEYLIDEVSWQLYWLDVAHSLNDLMNELISYWFDVKKDFRDYLLECVKIKTIVDEKLKKFDKNEVFEDLGYEINREVSNKNFVVRVTNDEMTVFIQNLYKQLYTNSLIDIDFEEFIPHFDKYTSSQTKIKWFGTEIELVSLFNILINKGVFKQPHKSNYLKMITHHFLNKNGKTLNNRQLSVSQSKLYNEKLYQRIINIINELSINKN